MKAILRSINNFSCKLKQSNNLKYNISPKIRSNKFKNISGNGNIVIEDALNKDLKDYKIYGNTYQNSTSGKNLYYGNSNSYTFTNSETATWYFVNGVRQAYGTTIGTKTLYKAKVEENKTYTLKAKLSGVTLTNQLVYENENIVASISKTELENGITFISNRNGYVILRLRVDTDVTISISDIQLEEGTIATDYEPYTGGQPSPNPDYPQEIISCGDSAKNLATNFDNGWYNGPNQIFTTANNFKRCIAKIKPNTTYTISKKNASNRFVVITSEVEIEPTVSYKRIVLIEQNTNTTQYTFTTQADENYLFFGYYSGTNETEIELAEEEIMIEEGSTATSYEPYYEGYKIPINVRSENLFDKDNANVYGGYLNASGVIKGNGSQTANTIVYIECKPNTTYFLKKKLQVDTENNRFRIGCTSEIPIVDMQTTNFFSYSDGTTETQYVYTTSSTAKYLLFYCGYASTTTSREEILDSIMILEGSTAPSKYIPYYNGTTNIYLDEPLRKIDGYSDYIDFINGKVVRNIKEVVLDGSENWASASASGNYSRFVCNAYNDALIPIDLNTIGNILSDKFIPRTANETANAITGIAIAGSGRFVIYYDLTKDYTTTQFKTWLSSNNITVDYALSTPTEEDIELPNINLIEGKNIITIGTEVQGVFEVEYYSKEIIDISNYKYNLRKVED